MSDNKKKKTAVRKKAVRIRKILWAICIVLTVLVAAMIAMVIHMESSDRDKQATEGAVLETEPVESVHSDTVEQPGTPETEGKADVPECLFELGGGVQIVKLLPYTGAFMEDRTDEVVTDVLAIQVINAGEQSVQTMDITLTAGETTAEFSLSTLLPGDTMVVLEKNRMAFSTAPEFTEASAGTIALFASTPTKCEDKLEIQCLDGVINVTNISGEDITGDIRIYYKNYISGIYYGGITYMIRIEGGLKAGQIVQGTAAHFKPSNSTVVFVTCG